ncbi:hypothetical protein TSAR_001473 [Trichomalopsis sarcophagae]|uniref:Uncharacterized protein n=1 Tax=Trichomalopsis sarcophagae TaxID=543379 RepID=A0A232F118_9HYME|nr:hypothetical protein TSAR_001473 [Trichomalopsis sarcophagae]
MKYILFLLLLTAVFAKNVKSIQTECTPAEVESCMQTTQCHKPGYHVVCRMKKNVFFPWTFQVLVYKQWYWGLRS